MTRSLRVRLLGERDLEFAHSLRERIGWNQTRQDWRRLLQYEPAGCFVAEWDGVPAGTATTSRYGRDVAWIGMVLVDPEFRRRGIGKALLEHCLEYLHTGSVYTIKLDATPLGQPLYAQLGFVEDWRLQRWHRPGKSRPGVAREACPSLQLTDSVRPLDASAFGVDRWRMIVELHRDSYASDVRVDSSGQATAYGLLRPGANADYLGPIVASSAEEGTSVARKLLTAAAEAPIFWDIPESNLAATELAAELGFAPQRPLIRMYLGDEAYSGDPARQFAIACPSIG